MTYTMNIRAAEGAVKTFIHRDILPEHLEEDRVYVEILDRVGPYTMTIANGAGATYNLFKSVRYIVENTIPGAIVECGVWRGGSMMLVAHALRYFGDTARELYLYDTFCGMTEPGDCDIDYDGRALKAIWQSARNAGRTLAHGGTEEEVKDNLGRTGYPPDRLRFVKGDVLVTLPAVLPGEIALLRLDTDFYKSTLHELTHLYPLVTLNGVVYIDDYGWCQGARRAADEFFSFITPRPFLIRIDECVRLLIKPSPATAHRLQQL